MGGKGIKAVARSAAVVLAVLAYISASYASGIDRLSLANPALERLVPGPFRKNADLQRSAIATANKNYTLATLAAQRAVSESPASYLSAAQLGEVQLLSGEAARARNSFWVSAKLGWRNQLTQAYWFEVFDQAGDYDRAAERLDALMRIDPQMTAAKAAIQTLEETAAGRNAIAERAARKPVWLRYMLNGTKSLPDAAIANRAMTILRISHIAGPLGCRATAGFTKGLIRRGAVRKAQMVWQANCDAGAVIGKLADADFSAFLTHADADMDGWHRIPDGNVALYEGVNTQGKKVLVVNNVASLARPVLSQELLLKPGRYQLQVSASQPGQAALSLDCGQPQRPEFSAKNMAYAEASCHHQTLTLWIAADTDALRITSIDLPRLVVRGAPTDRNLD